MESKHLFTDRVFPPQPKQRFHAFRFPPAICERKQDNSRKPGSLLGQRTSKLFVFQDFPFDVFEIVKTAKMRLFQAPRFEMFAIGA
jgi:hypothetical protein